MGDSEREEWQMGRPKKYDVEFVRDEAREFLKFVVERDGQKREGEDKAKPIALFVADFIVTRDYHPNRWGEWKRDFGKDDIYSGLVKRGEMVLEGRLTRMGLSKNGNPAMVIFLMANHYGYSRTDRQLSVNMNIDLDSLNDEQLERIGAGETLESVLANPGTGASEA